MSSPSAEKKSPAPQKRRRQPERTAETTANFMEAATELLIEKGLRGVTLTNLAKRIGYSISLASYHFGSKDALARHLLDDILHYGLGMLYSDDHRSDTPTVRLGHLIDSVMVGRAERPKLSRAYSVLLAEGVCSGDPDIRQRLAELNRQVENTVANIIAEGMKVGEMRPDIDVEATARGISASLSALGMLEHGTADYQFYQSAYRAFKEMVCFGLAERSGRI